jgi:hypothetical protein
MSPKMTSSRAPLRANAYRGRRVWLEVLEARLSRLGPPQAAEPTLPGPPPPPAASGQAPPPPCFSGLSVWVGTRVRCGGHLPWAADGWRNRRGGPFRAQ